MEKNRITVAEAQREDDDDTDFSNSSSRGAEGGVYRCNGKNGTFAIGGNRQDSSVPFRAIHSRFRPTSTGFRAMALTML